MKKKRKILSIISSIFGVFAVCGFSLFFLLDQKKKSQSVSALAGDLILEQNSFNGSLSWNASNDDYSGVTSINYNGSYTYFVRYTGSVDVVYLKFFITFGFDFYDSSSGELVVLTPSVATFTSDEVQVNTTNQAGVYQLYMSLTSTFAWTQPYLLFVSRYNDSQGVVCGYTENLTFNPTGYPIKIGQNTASSIIFAFSYSGNIPSYQTAWNEGNQIGYQNGYSNGISEGVDIGYQSGYADGVNSQQELISNAFSQGYTSGYSQGSSTDSTVGTIFSKIFLVAMLPVDFFLRILNWEILGVNIASFVSALLSVAATVIVIRLVTGKKE